MNKVTIDSIAFIADGNYSSKYPRADEFKMEGVPFIRANNFFNSTISDDDMLFISKEKHSELKKGHLEADDVLITTRGNIGKTVLVPKKHAGSNINAQIVLLRCKNTILPKYLLHVFKIPFVENQLMNFTTGTALKQLPVGNLRKIQIPLPPLSIQKAIAEKLDKADALRKKDKELLAQYDELAQAIFIDMFGDPVRNERGWESDELSKTAPFKKYEGNVSTNEGKFWLLNLDMIKAQTGEIIEKNYVAQNEITNSTISFNEDQVLYSKLRPYLNKVVIPTGSGYATSELIPMNPVKEKLNKYFLVYLLRSKSFVNYIEEKVAGAKMPRVSMDTLRDFAVILPPLLMQTQFAEKIQNIEAQKAIVRQQAQQSEDLFQALLQESFNFN